MTTSVKLKPQSIQDELIGIRGLIEDYLGSRFESYKIKVLWINPSNNATQSFELHLIAGVRLRSYPPKLRFWRKRKRPSHRIEIEGRFSDWPSLQGDLEKEVTELIRIISMN